MLTTIVTVQPKNNNLDDMIDPVLRNIYRLFVLSFKNADNDLRKKCFDKFYMALVEIKDFNGLIDNKPFFDQPVKNKQNVSRKLVEMSRNGNSTTKNLSDQLDHQKYYNLISIDLSKQTNRSIPQENNFMAKLEEKKQKMYKTVFITKNQQKTILNFSLDSLFARE